MGTSGPRDLGMRLLTREGSCSVWATQRFCVGPKERRNQSNYCTDLWGSQDRDLFVVGNETSVEVESQFFTWEVTTGLERDAG